MRISLKAFLFAVPFLAVPSLPETTHGSTDRSMPSTDSFLRYSAIDCQSFNSFVSPRSHAHASLASPFCLFAALASSLNENSNNSSANLVSISANAKQARASKEKAAEGKRNGGDQLVQCMLINLFASYSPLPCNHRVSRLQFLLFLFPLFPFRSAHRLQEKCKSSPTLCNRSQLRRNICTSEDCVYVRIRFGVFSRARARDTSGAPFGTGEG